jgi:branched-chain amino acid transport system substrate-binding protein
MKKLLTIVSVLMIMSMVLAACASPTPAPTQAPTEAPTAATTEAPTAEPTPAGLTCAEPIKVGLITDMSGALASYGEMILRSFMLGMEYAAGAPGSAGDVFDFTTTQENTFKVENCEIQVFVRDDASTPDTTTTVANELIEVQKVNILVGTANSAAVATLQGIALANKIPLIVAPAAANDITGVNFNEYTFRVSRNNYQDAINECSALTKSYKKLIQIAADYAFGRGSAAAFRDACTLQGATFVADDIFAPLTTTDFTPYMEQIAKSGAEAYIVTWAGAGFVALIKAAADQGVTGNIALGTTFVNNAVMPALYSNYIGTTAGIVYAYKAPKNEINDFLVAQEQARYKAVPDLFDADGMNAALMIVAALKKTNGDVNGDVLVKAMEGLSFDGPKGKVDIRPEDHVAIQDMYVLTLNNLTDPNADYYTLVETTRPEPPCMLPENLKARCGALPYGTLTGQ